MNSDSRRDFAGDFWTSGVKDGGGNFVWLAFEKPFGQSSKWRSGEPSAKGDCVYVESRNSTENTSLVAENCGEKKKFICEVECFISLRRKYFLNFY